MRRLANREEARHRAESVLRRQFGQAAVSVTRQSLAEDLLFALDELDETQPQWNVFDKDDPETWPDPNEIVWVALRKEGQRCVSREPFGDWWKDTVDFWQPIPIPEPPKEEK